MEEKKEKKKKQLYFNDSKDLFVSNAFANAFPASASRPLYPTLQKGRLKGKKGMLVLAYRQRIKVDTT